ncbi:MAG: Na+/H+ antiporter subunit E [Gammaproteobacteria bacterium]|nr:Na+/H+ antiporter subunit E [Gammaproteobacteria bacterium]MCF6229876.1 Na+/H+ antiporter subunit E [Gammaproteobacteria bacterium]
MKLLKRLLPHPIFSLVLLVVWLLLNNTLSAGHILLGSVIALVLPWATAGFWAEQLHLHKPGLAIKFLLLVLWDITVANIQVAKLILSPRRKLRPAFVHYPLDMDNEFAITVLAATISLTPGTVSIDVNDDHSMLLLHGLDVDDEAALIAEIKSRYEAPIKEIFGC